MNGQKMFMIVDIDRCWGCKACQVACKREHGLASEDFKPVEVFRVENMQGDKVRCDFLPVACQHCTSPACAEACPRGALVRTDEGLIAGSLHWLRTVLSKMSLRCHWTENGGRQTKGGQM